MRLTFSGVGDLLELSRRAVVGARCGSASVAMRRRSRVRVAAVAGRETRWGRFETRPDTDAGDPVRADGQVR